jgi:hypothetical protein
MIKALRVPKLTKYQAARCKRLALAVLNKKDSEILAKRAERCAATASALRATNS